jgi:hypothetical protein
MKFAVITSICGNREGLSNPIVHFDNAEYFAFVDKKNPSADMWNQLDPVHFSNDPKYANRRNAKIYKILPELFVTGYDAYFWVDASHDLVMDPQEVYDEYLRESDYAFFKHSQRDCIYEEAKLLKRIGYDFPDNIQREMDFFKSLNYPEKNGLFELSSFVKKRSDKSLEVSLKWWEYICKYSSRDQISLPVCLWECGVAPSIMPGFANGFNAQGKIGNNSIMPQTREHVPSGV